jgi:thiol-disulfide isomerase/thioredoxin
MKQGFLFLAFLATQSLLLAQGMTFHQGTWAEVQADAKAQNKPIFVDAYATWCGPCKNMSANVFPDTKVGEFMNKNYINYKLDVEKGEGIAFAEKYSVKLLPTLYYFNPSGELSHKVVGGLNTDNFISSSESALKPENQLYAQKAKYDKGQRDKAFVFSYLAMLIDASEQEESASVMQVYWALLDEKEKVSVETTNLLFSVVRDHKSTIFKYFIEHKADYLKTNNEELINSYLNMVFNDAATVATAGDVTKNLKKELKALAKELYYILPDKKDYVEAKIEYIYYAQREDASKAAQKAYHRYFSKFESRWDRLNGAAWQVVESQDKQQYKNALAWINRSVSMDKNYYNMDTKAWLLHLMGNNKAAMATAKEAVELAKAAGEDPAATLELISEIEAK